MSKNEFLLRLRRTDLTLIIPSSWPEMFRKTDQELSPTHLDCGKSNNKGNINYMSNIYKRYK
jgi:hypothetical protein